MIRPWRRRPRTQAVGVVLPVHNEEQLLASALSAIDLAFLPIAGSTLGCCIAIVLDACSDDSAAVATRWALRERAPCGSPALLLLRSPDRGVGPARAAGSTALLRWWRDLDPSQIWLASTDADSQVPPSWLEAQVDAHEQGADLWAGRVAVEDWSRHHSETASAWSEFYAREPKPVHGASLGCNAQAYLRAGGFGSGVTGEDRALYQAMAACGARIHHADEPRVITSGRRQARAPAGFSAVLSAFDDDVRQQAQIVQVGRRSAVRSLRAQPLWPTARRGWWTSADSGARA